jgi:amino-acid N-acetyltransferase
MSGLNLTRTLQLRAASELDRPAVASLLSTANLAAIDSAAQFGPQYVVAVHASGILAGVAGLEIYGSDALLRSVAVAPSLRAKGLGQRLTQDRMRWAAEQGIKCAYLLTMDARSYWERYGFEVIDRGDAPPGVQASTQWAGGCSATAVAMRKAL